MKIPLLLNATPRSLSTTPKIHLPFSVWQYHTENQKDSLFHIYEDGQTVQVIFDEAGTERNLSIYAVG